MNQKSSPFQTPAKPNYKSHTNFIEALKSIGGSTVQSVGHDVIGGTSKDFVNSLTGNNTGSTENYRKENNIDQQEQIRQEALRLQRHKELTETRLFDRREEEIKKRIEVVQEELKMLAKELAGMDKQLEKAISEEVVSPGAYHVSFFEKLRRFIIDLRKRVQDSANWLEVSVQRKNAKQGYWGKVAQHGTKFMLSQERYMATQAG